MNIRKILVGILCVLLLFGLMGCGASESMGDNASNQMGGNYISKEEVTTDADISSSLPENRKMIQTVTMQAETENLDTVLQQLDSRISQLGGYVEKSDVQNGSAYSGKRYRSASITIRIPAEEVDSFIDKVGDISNIVSSKKTVEDVTLSYVATESRMKALQAEEARLLELMSKAATLDELLTVEKRLTEVRTELEQVTSALRVLDNRVEYATLHLSISEVKEFTEVGEQDTVWQRIAVGFTKSLKNVGYILQELFVLLVVSIPYFIPLAVVGLCVLLIVWMVRRRNAKKVNKQQEDITKS